jgi:hypothetical protein
VEDAGDGDGRSKVLFVGPGLGLEFSKDGRADRRSRSRIELGFALAGRPHRTLPDGRGKLGHC